MQAVENPEREFWWTVALEAAVFFSLPTWAVTVESAWPTDSPYDFAFALTAGAFAAMLLCHIAPAFWIRNLSGFGSGPWQKVTRWVVVVLLCAGAGVYCGQIAHYSVFLTRIWHEDRRWDPVTAGAVIALVGAVSGTIGWSGLRVRRAATLVLCVTGVGLVAGALFAQWQGLSAGTLSMVREVGLNDPQKLFIGILLAAAPVMVLATRIGSMPIGRGRVWLSGVAGVWLPLVVSMTLCSLARVAGARLYWRPSLPVGFAYAFTLFGDRPIQISWSLATFTILGPCVVCVIWLKDSTAHWPWRWQRSLVVAIAIAGFIHGARIWDQWPSWDLYRPWCWVLLSGSALLWLGSSVLSCRRSL